MKNLLFTCMVFSATSCLTMFDSKEDLMGKFILKDGNLIEVINVGTGATSPDVIWINKTNKNGERFSIDSIMIGGGGLGYNLAFQQINDTLLKITFIDTLVFIDQKKEWLVNLKNRIK